MDEGDEDFVLEEEGESLADTLKKLRERLKTATKEKQEYLEGWQRARADFTNEKREMEARKSELASDVKAKVAEKVVPLLDSFDQALSQESFKTLDASWQKGIKSLQDEAQKILKDLGVEQFNPEGMEFDPNTMNAVGEGAGAPNTVLAVVRQGYKMNGKIIREAYVVVGRGEEDRK